MDEYHIIPENDTYNHVTSDECECQPDVEMVKESLVITHYSFDGREVVEWVNNLINNNGKEKN